MDRLYLFDTWTMPESSSITRGDKENDLACLAYTKIRNKIDADEALRICLSKVGGSLDVY